MALNAYPLPTVKEKFRYTINAVARLATVTS